jgi:outer membrane protein TolC
MNLRPLALCALLVLCLPLRSGEPVHSRRRAGPQTINLASALRLAGAQNLDVKLAGEKVALAQAEHQIARQQFFPWLTIGAGWRGHQENIQTVDGLIIDAEKSAVDVGAAIRAQLDLGEAYYKSLATRQLVKAATYADDAQKRDAVHAAALAYFDLVRAHANVDVSAEAVRITQDYGAQVKRAVEAGIGFAGDAYRIETQLEANRLAEQQAREIRRVAAARLAQVLHLDPAVELVPAESAPLPLQILSASQPLEHFVQRAIAQRPEMQMSEAQREAARQARDGAKYAPLVPSLSGQYSYGGLGGGRGSEISNFDESSDYGIALSWRVGPGGLFDRGRIQASESQLRTSAIEAEKLRDEIVRQVVESHTRVRSLHAQMAMAERALTAGQKTLDLSRDRKEFGVGVVAETIQSEQDLTRARREYFAAVAEYNKAQYSLRRAIGAEAAGGNSKEVRRRRR